MHMQQSHNEYLRGLGKGDQLRTTLASSTAMLFWR